MESRRERVKDSTGRTIRNLHQSANIPSQIHRRAFNSQIESKENNIAFLNPVFFAFKSQNSFALGRLE